MEIKVVENAAAIESDILVVNQFEDGRTTNNLANKYAVDEDNFKGKFGETYLLHTLGNEPYRKILIIGFGKKEEFCPNKLREAVAKAVKKSIHEQIFSLSGFLCFICLQNTFSRFLCLF